MFNRRILRVKAFKILYSNISSGSDSILSAEKELISSCEQCRDLYLLMLNLPRALRDADGEMIEARMNKLRPTAEDMNPNRKFFGNLLVEMLDNSYQFTGLCDKKGLDWKEHDAFVRKLYRTVVSRDYFKEYMQSPDRSLAEDCSLFIKIYERELEDNEELAQILEDMSIYWTDDLGYVLNYAVRTLKGVKKGELITVPPLFQSEAAQAPAAGVEDDRAYVIRLLDYAMANYNKLFSKISESVKNWDSDRLVSTDAALIVLGLSEAVLFPEIPVKVTINEYVEISKYYSTANSRLFVNGLLDRLIQKGIQDGEIVKSGKGLI